MAAAADRGEVRERGLTCCPRGDVRSGESPGRKRAAVAEAGAVLVEKEG
jgi:hypothetical protein